MTTTRTLIAQGLDALTDGQRGLDFQRLAQQCLRDRWPSLASVPERADLGEDGITILGERSDGIRRSLLCSLTATIGKVRADATKLQSRGVAIDEIIFATPKAVDRRKQDRWSSAIRQEFGWALVVVERSEFLTVLARPENHWICRQHLGLDLGYRGLVEEAKTARKAGRLSDAKHLAEEAERAGLAARDDEVICRARILQAELVLEEGDATTFKDRAFFALQTVQDKGVDGLLSECLILAANAVMPGEPERAGDLLAEAERHLLPKDRKGRRWLLLVRARLEEGSGRLDAAERTLREWQSLDRRGEDVDYQGFNYLRFRIEAKKGERSALKHLDEALRLARTKNRWTFVGDMLFERALLLAKSNNLVGATTDAREAAVAYGKARNIVGELRALLLASQIQLDAREAEAALALADEVLRHDEVQLHRTAATGALQVRTRALQALGRTNEARECNRHYREMVALEPQALVVADAQEAMLLAQEGKLEGAAELMAKALERAQLVGVESVFIAAIRVHLANILAQQAKLREAGELLEQALPEGERLPPRAREDLHRMRAYVRAVEPVRAEFENFVMAEHPLEVAGTAGSRGIHAAHRSILQMPMEWVANFPKAAAGILDFWGRGNFARYLLNHRGFPNVWHVTVEATTVAQADHWTRTLGPIVDVLTILWKGPVRSALCMTPIHIEYEGPGGWGYTIAAGDELRSETDPSDWNWAPAMGYATLLPDDAAEFFFSTARTWLEAGRLFLFPAVNVGCVGKGHSPLERMFNSVANAIPWLSGEGGNSDAKALASFPLPYFPDIPLNELAHVVEGEEDSLLELRRALRAWAVAAGDGALEQATRRRELQEEMESGLRAVERTYEALARKLSWGRASGEIRSYALEPSDVRIEPPSLAAAALADLYRDLHASPWYAFFRMSRAGYRWDLTRNAPASTESARTVDGPQRVYHWIVPPRGGWTIPTMFVGDASGPTR